MRSGPNEGFIIKMMWVSTRFPVKRCGRQLSYRKPGPGHIDISNIDGVVDYQNGVNQMISGHAVDLSASLPGPDVVNEVVELIQG